MVGTSAKTDKQDAPRIDVEAAAGRVLKKRGLSRHYPHKAQSFDCLQSALNTSLGDSSLALSKMYSGLSHRYSSPRGARAAGLYRRQSSTPLASESDPCASWRTLEDLCDSFSTSSVSSRCPVASPVVSQVSAYGS